MFPSDYHCSDAIYRHILNISIRLLLIMKLSHYLDVYFINISSFVVQTVIDIMIYAILYSDKGIQPLPQLSSLSMRAVYLC